MIRGLYTSAWSMNADIKKMDVIANNLANADTNGYKKDVTIDRSFESLLTKRVDDYSTRSNPTSNVGRMKLGRDVADIHTYFEQGNLISTEEKLNFAIADNENAFFAIGEIDKNGNMIERYSRDGSFIMNTEGRLATGKGNYLLGENGPIVIRSDDIVVTNDGSIYENDEFIDKIKVVSFDNSNNNVYKIGNNLFAAKEGAQQIPFEGRVVQGSLEKSNVNAISEMINMITVLRSYEANQKLVQVQDNTLQKAVNEIGILR